MRNVILLLVAAFVAALFGFGAMGSYSWEGARQFCYILLLLAALTLVFGTGFFRRSA